MKVAVTGGSGSIGAYTVKEFTEHGYEVRNFDIAARTGEGVPCTRVDFSNFGDVVSVLQGYDAIVHLAAIIAPGRTSNNQIYRTNVVSTFNVLEAASLLGIRKICLASSINAIGAAFNVENHFKYFPVDEEHPRNPDEAYGLSKQTGEILADGFALRFPEMTISSMRYPAVFTPERYAMLDGETPKRRKALWCGADIRDIVRANRLAIEAEWTGHEVFFLNMANTTSETPTAELIATYFPDVELREEFPGNKALISSRKAERLLGWKAELDFREEKQKYSKGS